MSLLPESFKNECDKNVIQMCHTCNTHLMSHVCNIVSISISKQPCPPHSGRRLQLMYKFERLYCPCGVYYNDAMSGSVADVGEEVARLVLEESCGVRLKTDCLPKLAKVGHRVQDIRLERERCCLNLECRYTEQVAPPRFIYHYTSHAAVDSIRKTGKIHMASRAAEGPGMQIRIEARMIGRSWSLLVPVPMKRIRYK